MRTAGCCRADKQSTDRNKSVISEYDSISENKQTEIHLTYVYVTQCHNKQKAKERLKEEERKRIACGKPEKVRLAEQQAAHYVCRERFFFYF